MVSESKKSFWSVEYTGVELINITHNVTSSIPVQCSGYSLKHININKCLQSIN